MSTAIMPQDSPPVLIIRLDGIGDALALTPLLAALRERAIPVDLILRRENAGIFSRLGARHVEIAPFALRSSTAENLRRIADFAATLAPRGYASVLVATEDPGGYRLAHAIGAPSCGFDNGWGKPLKTLWVRSMLTRTLYRPAGLDARGRHECEMLFELGRALLGDAQPTRALEGLRPLLIAAELRRDERVVVQITEKWRHFGVLAHEVAAVLQALARDRTVRAIASAREGAFADAVAGLKKGEITPQPVQTQFGWHVIQLEDTREKTPPPFDQVKAQLTNQVIRKRLQAYVADLKKNAKIEKKQ